MTSQKIVVQIIRGLVLCLFVESICFFILRSNNQSVGFLFNINGRNEVNKTKGFGFNEIDPLCGWATKSSTIQDMGYKVKYDCEVLQSNGDYPSKPIKILISGGSTSDIALHKENWPNELYKLFLEKKINATIYVAAVGGFSSGQELLKLLRIEWQIEPNIHISYSGNNDGEDGGYVSSYEQSFYETAYRERATSPILPSTIFLFKKALNLSYDDLIIKKKDSIPSFIFWKQNMNTMKGLAQINGYKFIGILSPILGFGNYHQDIEKDKDIIKRIEGYKQYYPQAQKHVLTDSLLYDFTGIFDTIKGQVYKDDSHINSVYQALVAQNVFKLLDAKGCFAPKNKVR